MLRMRNLAATLLVALCAAGGIAATSASAGSSSSGPEQTYRRYALIRDQLIACSLDRQVHQLVDEARKRCPRYRELYTLWSNPGESFNYHVHCNTRKSCPAQPIGEPDPRRAIPAGSKTFR